MYVPDAGSPVLVAGDAGVTIFSEGTLTVVDFMTATQVTVNATNQSILERIILLVGQIHRRRSVFRIGIRIGGRRMEARRR